MKRALLATLCSAALVAGCGEGEPPVPDEGGLGASSNSAAVYDPLADPLRCLGARGVKAKKTESNRIEIDAPGDPYIVFAATASDARNQQIRGDAEGAEVIGSTLLHTGTSTDQVLEPIEKCLEETAPKRG